MIYRQHEIKLAPGTKPFDEWAARQKLVEDLLGGLAVSLDFDMPYEIRLSEEVEYDRGGGRLAITLRCRRA